MAENKTLEHLSEVRAAVAALSPEDREVLAAVQTSPFKLTTPEQFKEFADNIDYFVFEPNIHDLNDLGWRYLAQHMDMLLPPELLKAIDPVPFGKYAIQEEQGHFTKHRYISLSGDEWNHERPAEPEKKPSIRERLEQGKKPRGTQSGRRRRSLPSVSGWRTPNGNVPSINHKRARSPAVMCRSMTAYEPKQEMAAGMGIFPG